MSGRESGARHAGDDDGGSLGEGSGREAGNTSAARAGGALTTALAALAARGSRVVAGSSPDSASSVRELPHDTQAAVPSTA